MDCLGCGNCVDICPGNPKATTEDKKALSMATLQSQYSEADNWNYCVKECKDKQDLIDVKQSPKNSQFATHYLSSPELVPGAVRLHTSN